MEHSNRVIKKPFMKRLTMQNERAAITTGPEWAKERKWFLQLCECNGQREMLPNIWILVDAQDYQTFAWRRGSKGNIPGHVSSAFLSPASASPAEPTRRSEDRLTHDFRGQPSGDAAQHDQGKNGHGEVNSEFVLSGKHEELSVLLVFKISKHYRIYFQKIRHFLPKYHQSPKI